MNIDTSRVSGFFTHMWHTLMWMLLWMLIFYLTSANVDVDINLDANYIDFVNFFNKFITLKTNLSYYLILLEFYQNYI